VGWYRFTVNWEGKPDAGAGLHLPDRRGSAVWLWSNGEFVGYLAAGASERTLDLTGRLTTGRNELVLRAEGAGGLALPPFLFRFTGKRLTEIGTLPGQWLFRTDPNDRGIAEGWQRTDLDAADWQPIAVPIAWEQTAVGAYDGYAWYRVRFTVPAEHAGRDLVLRFGGVDEQAWVYLNGELIGEHTEQSTGRTIHQIWDEPFDVPLPAARLTEENVLAVRVHDSLMAGGIHLPVRLGVEIEAE
jgi:hypothetical protein